MRKHGVTPEAEIARMRLFAYQPLSVWADIKDVPQYAIAQSCGEIAVISKLAETYDEEWLVVLED